MTDHQHLWHERADGTIGCALQGCGAEPMVLQAAEVLAELETRAAISSMVGLTWAGAAFVPRQPR